MEEQQQQNDDKQRACDRKKEKQRIFDLNKRFEKFIDQVQFEQKNKPHTETFLIQEKQQISLENAQGLVVMHHGNGDQNDYEVLKTYFNQFVEKEEEISVYVFPAYAYAYIQFKDTGIIKKCLEALEIQRFDKNIKFQKQKKTENNQEKEEENLTEQQQQQYYGDKKDEQYIIYHNQLNFLNFKGKEHTRLCLYVPTQNNLDFFDNKSTNSIPDAETTIDIPGLYLIPEFITQEQEKQLIAEADGGDWKSLSKRLVQHQGYEFIYGENSVKKQNKVCDFKPEAKILGDQIDEQILKSGFKQSKLDQMTINSYDPGAGIPPHVDSHQPFEEVFAAVSLADGVVMTFKNIQGEEKSVFLPQRTLIVFSGEARYAWQHSISSRKIDKVNQQIKFRNRRVSYTYRALRKDESKCECIWNYFCDNQGYNADTMRKPNFNNLKPKHLNRKAEATTVFARNEDEVKMMDQIQENFKKEQLKDKNEEEVETQLLPSEVEKTYVYDVYDKIASHFSCTRYKPWPKVSEFLDSIPQGSLVADVGCGNGKYLSTKQNQEGDYFMIGTDRSVNLIEICRQREKECQVFSADSLKLPWRSNLFDAVISIAVIHHFSNDALRLQALKEIHRIMAPGGRALIYVWALEQKQKNVQEQDVFVPWHNQFKFENQNEKKEKTQKKTKKQKQEEKLQKQKEEEEEQQKQQKLDEEQKNSNYNGDEQEENELKNMKWEERQKEAEKHQHKEQDSKVSKVDAEKQSVVYKRYYHMFKEGELEALVNKSKLFDIEDSYFDHANWVVILRKKEKQ